MNFDQLDALQFTVVPLLALIISVIAGSFGFWWGNRRKQIDLTLDMWKLWSTTEMRNARVNIGHKFKLVESETGDRPRYQQISYHDLMASAGEEERPKMIFYYGQLSHFLIELNAVKRQGELRNKLFLELFSHPLEHWRGRFDALYFDADRSGNMREQLETYERLKVAMVNLVGKRK